MSDDAKELLQIFVRCVKMFVKLLEDFLEKK
jgi:hypothetical protein